MGSTLSALVVVGTYLHGVSGDGFLSESQLSCNRVETHIKPLPTLEDVFIVSEDCCVQDERPSELLDSALPRYCEELSVLVGGLPITEIARPGSVTMNYMYIKNVDTGQRICQPIKINAIIVIRVDNLLERLLIVILLSVNHREKWI